MPINIDAYDEAGPILIDFYYSTVSFVREPASSMLMESGGLSARS